MIAGNELMISERKSRKSLNRDISTDNNLIYHLTNRNVVLEVLLKRTPKSFHQIDMCFKCLSSIIGLLACQERAKPSIRIGSF
jgi:hypothetical protein